jgi:hypothetical protein
MHDTSDKLEFISLFISFLTFFFGLILFSSEVKDYARVVISFIIVALNLLFVIYSAYLIIRATIEYVRDRLQAAKLEEQELQSAAAAAAAGTGTGAICHEQVSQSEVLLLSNFASVSERIPMVTSQFRVPVADNAVDSLTLDNSLQERPVAAVESLSASIGTQQNFTAELSAEQGVNEIHFQTSPRSTSSAINAGNIELSILEISDAELH